MLMSETLRNWLALRSQRERILLWLLVVAVVYATSFYCLMAASTYHQAEVSNFQESRAWADWIERFVDSPQFQTSSDGVIADGVKLNYVTQQATIHDIELSRIQPDGLTVTVELKDQQFDSMINWLIALRENHRLRVTFADVSTRGTSGISARIVVE